MLTFFIVLTVFAAASLVTRYFYASCQKAGKDTKAIVISAALIVFLLTIDRITKVLLAAYLSAKQSQEIIPGVIGLYLLEGGNTGAAWGILSDATWLLSITTCIVIIAGLYIAFIKKLYSSWMHTALLLVIAGGAGNLYDRVVYGSVTDFLQFLFMQFPIFNFADCCVTAGAGMALITLFFAKKDDPLFAVSKAKETEAKSNMMDNLKETSDEKARDQDG